MALLAFYKLLQWTFGTEGSKGRKDCRCSKISVLSKRREGMLARPRNSEQANGGEVFCRAISSVVRSLSSYVLAQRSSDVPWAFRGFRRSVDRELHSENHPVLGSWNKSIQDYLVLTSFTDRTKKHWVAFKVHQRSDFGAIGLSNSVILRSATSSTRRFIPTKIDDVAPHICVVMGEEALVPKRRRTCVKTGCRTCK